MKSYVCQIICCAVMFSSDVVKVSKIDVDGQGQLTSLSVYVDLTPESLILTK